MSRNKFEVKTHTQKLSELTVTLVTLFTSKNIDVTGEHHLLGPGLSWSLTIVEKWDLIL